MKVINNTNNTLYVDDLDIHLPYIDGEPEYISPDVLKKSQCIRTFILNGMLEVHEYDKNERIESSLIYMKNKLTKDLEKIKENKSSEEQEGSPPELVFCDDCLEVKVHGIFYDAGGYGKVNRNLAINLAKAGVKVQVDPKRSQNQLREEELEPIIKLTKNKVSRNHIQIDSVVPTFAEISSAKYKILYTTIESYTIPKQFMECCQMYDEIWLTSEWSASILRPHVDKPVYTVITGVDTDLYTESGPRFDFRPHIKDFVFVSVFGWNYRKGYDVLLRAYFDEFDSTDNVSLLIVSRFQSGSNRYHRNKIKDDIDKIMEEFPNKDLPHVVRYSQVTPEKDMPKLYRSANAFVLPSRGEGGGLPALEASMCGLPIIMTNCSGQQGYIHPDRSYPIEIDHLAKIQPGQMHLHYWDGQEFPSLLSKQVHESLKSTMRHVFENEEEAQGKNRNMQKFIMDNFTWTHTANAAIERLQDALKRIS